VRRELGLAQLTGLAAVMLQLLLLVAVLRLWNLETQAFENVAMLVLAAFLPHHFLPPRFRIAAFALLSVASVVQVFGTTTAAWVLVPGVVLMGLCHAPLAFGLRIALVLAAGGALAVARLSPAWWPEPLRFPGAIWPILGSMFMFRLPVYLYDLKHAAAPMGAWRALAYFFMLPNVCCPLFPVVDYQTMWRNHYNDDALRIYQLGTKWILRGLVHLLIYRFVYMRCMIDVNHARDALDVGQYVLTTFLLYLKISGLFHLVVGMLHLFGFNLPETHHLYLLSSSFTDFWRRINIYWKDFITKLVFYPLYFRWRTMPGTRAVVLATLVAFMATWLLHSYQWFWIRGTFPIVWSDLVFWLGLGLVVVVNVVWEQRRGRKRSLRAAPRSARQDLGLVLRTAGVFVAICILWTIWSTPHASELRLLLDASRNVTPTQAGVLLAVPLAIGVAALVLGRRTREHTEGVRARAVGKVERFWPSTLRVAAGAVALLVLAANPRWLPGDSMLAAVVPELRNRGLNRADQQALHRGYYEELGDVTRFDNELWRMYGLAPKKWGHEMDIHADRTDALIYTHRPGLSGLHKEKAFSTNSHGLRDREYTLEKPAGTFRIALIGASHDAGSGVADNETYENVLEDSLNRGAGAAQRFEVLNFSAEGFAPVQKVVASEIWVPQFQPDVVLYAASRNEMSWTFLRLADYMRRGIVGEYPFFADALEAAGIAPGDTSIAPAELERRLEPQAGAALGRMFQRFSAAARACGARPVLVLTELPIDAQRPESFDALAGLARAAGADVIDLHGAFAAVSDRTTLWVAPWDDHTNALGHRLLGEKLLRELIAQGIVPAGATDAGEQHRSQGERDAN
jgi:D-alanyl-lipoteichoic acid acyltransferase DltB (MBOAT superfamily)